jgi:branched-chain amino acid aminotransferase
MVEKAKYIWLDGKFVAWDQAQVHILTHTLHYGLGVFEGIRAYLCTDGRTAIFRLPEHVHRLFDSGHIMQMEIPFSEAEISQACIETMRRNEQKEAYLRPLAFIGDGAMGLHPKDNPIRVAVITWVWGAYLGDEGLSLGIRLKTSSFTRHHVNVMMTKAKVVGNYVNSILAKREVIKSGYDEALLLDAAGYVAEASGENIFLVQNGVIKTPPLRAILPGITRDCVLTVPGTWAYPSRKSAFPGTSSTSPMKFFCPAQPPNSPRSGNWTTAPSVPVNPVPLLKRFKRPISPQSRAKIPVMPRGSRISKGWFQQLTFSWN